MIGGAFARLEPTFLGCGTESVSQLTCFTPDARHTPFENTYLHKCRQSEPAAARMVQQDLTQTSSQYIG